MSMSKEDYQNFVNEACYYRHVNRGDEHEYSYVALGLAGESGEYADATKKMLRRGHFGKNLQEFRPKRLEELGDTLWYLVRICAVEGITLGELMEMNTLKLCVRFDINWPGVYEEGSKTIEEWLKEMEEDDYAEK